MSRFPDQSLDFSLASYRCPDSSSCPYLTMGKPQGMFFFQTFYHLYPAYTSVGSTLYPLFFSRGTFFVNALYALFAFQIQKKHLFPEPSPPAPPGGGDLGRQPSAVGRQPLVHWTSLLLWKSRFSSFLLFQNNPRLAGTVSQDSDSIYAPLIQTYVSPEIKLRFLPVKYDRVYYSLGRFDRRTGKLLWQIGGHPEGKNFAQQVSIPQAPVIEGHSLYTSGILSPNQTDPFNLYLFALDSSQGRWLWKTFLGSGFLELNLFNNPAREPFPSSLVLQGDYLYYLSNMGLAACVQKETGQVVWIHKYWQYKLEATDNPYNVNFLPLGSVDNPLWLLSPGRESTVETGGNQTQNGEFPKTSFLAVAPMDAPYLYVFDAGSGALVHTLNLSSLGEVRYLLGYSSQGLLIQTDTMVANLDIQEGTVQWSVPFNKILGRSAVSRKYLYVPTEGYLVKLDYTNGGKAAAQWEWSENQPGNVFIPFDNFLVYAGQDFVKIYLDALE